MTRKNKVGEVLERIYRGFLYVLPAALFFSYHPVMRLGANEGMNFELSIALLWLAGFCLVSLVMIFSRGISLRGFLRKKWWWLLFPVFATVSLCWTENLVRGILTVLILWAIYFAVFAFYEFRELFDARTRRNFLRAFFGASLGVCLWCVLQCILDLCGVSRDFSLMCLGCRTEMFGFPHPNGFAIEPQFMGNLLLAPAIVSGVLIINDKLVRGDKILERRWVRILLFFVFVASLFLTFSRGAIYAFVVATAFYVGFEILRTKKWRAVSLVLVSGLAFLFTLNLQGIFAQVSGTNDTYFSGVAKVLNHLSLGVIDIRVTDEGEAGAIAEVSEEAVLAEENTVGKNEAVFDGYVEESTAIRMKLTEAAFKTFSRDVRTMMFGVGIGGAGEAMYLAGEIDSSKEIVQNEYVSVLLELGIFGAVLAILTLGLIARVILKNEKSGMVLSLIAAYAVSLFFFSGLTNALQIYLMPAAFYVINYMSLRKKLVS